VSTGFTWPLKFWEFFFCHTGIWTQGLHLFLFSYFLDRDSSFCLGLASHCNHLSFYLLSS
jgi:hypothetical protein